MRNPLVLLALALLLIPAFHARAGGFDPATVPAGAKWVLHLDADSTRASELWKLIEPRLEADERYGQFVAASRAYAGAEFPRDLHGLTVYGNGFNEESAVVLITADVDQARITDLLQLGAAEIPKTQGARQVFNWQDEKGQHYGGFAAGRFVIARSENNLHGAMDVLEEKRGALQAAPGLDGARKADVMLYVSGKDLQELAAVAKNPMVENVKDVWLALSSTADAVNVRGALSATNAETAAQVRDVLNGLKGMALLSVNDPKHDENTRAALQTLTKLTASVEGSAVQMDWSIPIPVVEQLIKAAEAKHAAQPARSAPAKQAE